MLIQQICYIVVLFCKQINFCSILCSVTLAAEICKCRFNAITTQPCYVHVHENDSQQVCVYIPTSAVNVTLLAYTAQCRAAVRLAAAAQGGRRYRSISPARRVHSSKPAAARVDHGSGPSAGRVGSGHQNRENQWVGSDGSGFGDMQFATDYNNGITYVMNVLSMRVGSGRVDNLCTRRVGSGHLHNGSGRIGSRKE